MNKIIVIGDLFLDHYIYYDNHKSLASLETGIKPLISIKEEYSPGAAGNVAKNLSLLDNEVYLVSVIGKDGNGFELKEALKKYKINFDYLIESKKRFTPVYTKFINNTSKKEDFPRYDKLPLNFLDKTDEELLILNFKNLVKEIDYVLVEDQFEYEGNGIITKELKRIINSLNEKRKVVFIDSRRMISEYLHGIKKPNISEYVEKFSDQIKEKLPPEIIVQNFLDKENTNKNNRTIVTADENGCYSYENKMKRYFYSQKEVVDVCGAGDAFIASYCSSKMKGMDEESSVINAMKSSSICIDQIGTGVVTQKLIEKKEKPFINEIDNKNVFLKNPFTFGKMSIAIFDFDGTISLLREGWQPVMAKLMLDKITGNKKISRELSKELLSRIDGFISETTGIQTILQMEGLVDLINEYGIVNGDEVKNAYEYKKEYTSILKKTVNKRKTENCDKYLIKGAKKFLKSLHERNIELYLASGTDRDDVVDEAKFLGVYKYFNENIYGALKSFKDFSKKKLVRKITEENLKQDKNIIIFGDGPVEIKVGKEFGVYTVGVASNELYGEGWNISKYDRLKKAGSDLLIPDFIEYKYLLNKFF